MPNGKGKFTYNYDRGKYEGEFQNGLKHGYGIEIHPCGTKYIGMFEQGEMNCKNAIYIYKSGTKYEGEIYHSRRNGHGTCYYPNGDKYTGEWRDDEKYGFGAYSYNEGETYEG